MKEGKRYMVQSSGNVYEVARVLKHESYPYVMHLVSMSDEFVASITADAERLSVGTAETISDCKQLPIRVEAKWFDRKDVSEVE